MPGLDSYEQSAWTAVALLLDEAMDRLRRTDQEAVLLRFFERRSLWEVGRVLGLSAKAADERVASGLGKLCTHLARKGVTVPKAVLASLLADNAVQEAPAGLAARTSAAVLAQLLPACQIRIPNAGKFASGVSGLRPRRP